MPLSLNTSHPLYADIVAFVCVDDDNTVKDLKGDTCTTDASVVIGTGTYGRHFQTQIVSNAAKGIALTNGHLTKPIGNPVGTSLIVINAGNSRASRGSVTNTPNVGTNSIGVYTGDVAGCQNTSNYPVALGTTDVIGTGAHTIAAAWNGTTEYKTWVDGNQEAVVSGNLGSASDTAKSTYIGGSNTGGFGGFAADYVYYIHFRKYLSEAELDEIYTSLGAGNQISLLESGGTTAISFTGTIPAQSATVGVPFNLNVSSYFSGTQTPFAYAIQSGTLPAGLSFETSTCIISGTPTGAEAQAIAIRGTDADLATADSNSFTITVAAAGSPPSGTFTVGTITTTQNTASVPYTYSAADQTSIEYRIDSGAAITATASPQSLTGLTPSTTYGIQFRAVNSFGEGAWSTSTSFTTEAAVVTATFTTGILRKLVGGTALANTALTYFRLYNPTTGALVVNRTDLSTDVDGRVTCVDAAITAGVDYKSDWLAATGETRMSKKAAT